MIRKYQNLLNCWKNAVKTPAGLLTLFFFGICIAYLPLLFWDSIPQRDIANRYAPMAEAFARGDFLYAFHPRCQMLHTSIAGIIAFCCGCDGYMACKISSFLFFALSAIPLFFLCRRIFGSRIAAGAVLLFAFASPLLSILAISGLRDAAKMFTLLLIAHALTRIVQERQNIWNYVYAGAGCGLGVCVRNEMLLVAAFTLFICGLLDRASHRWIGRSLTGVGTAVVISCAELIANYGVSGLAIPAARYRTLFLQIFKVEPTWIPMIFYAVIPACLLYIAGVYTVSKIASFRKGKACMITILVILVVALFYRIHVLASANPERAGIFVNSIMLGLTWSFFPAAVTGAVFRFLFRRWSQEETVIAVLFILTNLTAIVSIILHDNYLFVSKRYLLPAVPLLLPWSWYAWEQIWKLFHEKLHIPYTTLLRRITAAVLILLSLYSTYRERIKDQIRPKQIRLHQTIKTIAGRIRQEKYSFYTPELDLLHYKSNVRPLVYLDCHSKLTPAVYLGGGSTTPDPSAMDLLVTTAGKTGTQLKKQFPFIQEIKRRGDRIPFGKEKLQLWEVIRK